MIAQAIQSNQAVPNLTDIFLNFHAGYQGASGATQNPFPSGSSITVQICC